MLGLAGGVAIGLGVANLMDKKNNDPEDPDGKLKQQIMDKIIKLAEDLKKTV